jgi:hypothetical protein
MSRTLKRVVALACALAVAGPGTAVAASSPVTDCNAHGHLTQPYSVPQLRTALAQMPADVQEYTNCYNVIQGALLSQIPGGHAHASAPATVSSGSGLPTGVIVAIVVLALGAATSGAVAIRRRGASS